MTFSCFFFTARIENLPYFYFRPIWPNGLEHIVSHVVLCTKVIF